jgi:hypothetical protein
MDDGSRGTVPTAVAERHCADDARARMDLTGVLHAIGFVKHV